MVPRSGDVLRISSETSVQFVRPFRFRVIRVHDWPTYDGWCNVDGYQLDEVGDAVERRTLFLPVDRLERVNPPPVRSTPHRTRPTPPRRRAA